MSKKTREKFKMGNIFSSSRSRANAGSQSRPDSSQGYETPPQTPQSSPSPQYSTRPRHPPPISQPLPATPPLLILPHQDLSYEPKNFGQQSSRPGVENSIRAKDPEIFQPKQKGISKSPSSQVREYRQNRQTRSSTREKELLELDQERVRVRTIQDEIIHARAQLDEDMQVTTREKNQVALDREQITLERAHLQQEMQFIAFDRVRIDQERARVKEFTELVAQERETVARERDKITQNRVQIDQEREKISQEGSQLERDKKLVGQERGRISRESEEIAIERAKLEQEWKLVGQERDGITQERGRTIQDREKIAEGAQLERELKVIAQERDVISQERWRISREWESITQGVAQMEQEMKLVAQQRDAINQERERIRQERVQLAKEDAQLEQEKRLVSREEEKVNKERDGIGRGRAQIDQQREEIAQEGAQLERDRKIVAREGGKVAQQRDEIAQERGRIVQEREQNAKDQAQIEREKKLVAQEEERVAQERDGIARERVRIGQVKQELGKRPSTPVAQEIFQLRQENNNLQKDLDELQRLHIRSINGFGIDLEPITDEAFQKQFRELYSQVSRWCRRVSRSKNKNSHLGEGTSLLYPARCLDKTVVQNLSLANSVETATWMFMEKKILSVWFPGIGTELADSAAVLETLVRSGDNSSTKEKCEYWRSYTASLLFQNPQLQESFDTVSNLLTEDLQSSLSALLSEPSRLPALKDILHSTVTIYVSLKCQRDVYEIEDDVKPGIDFDESRMDDIEFTQLDSQERGVVTCVLAKGWVRRSYRGSKDVAGRVCNARVTIRKIS